MMKMILGVPGLVAGWRVESCPKKFKPRPGNGHPAASALTAPLGSFVSSES
jgi:hypothetical protein